MLWKILKVIWKIIWFLFVLLTLFLLFVSLFKKEWIELIITWFENIINHIWYYNYLIAFLSSMIEAFPVLWILLPWTNILLLVWWFFGKLSILNLFLMICIASVWAIIWNYIWYVLGYYFWDWFFEKYWDFVWIWKTEQKYLNAWIKKWWVWWIVVWKFHATTRTFIPFIAWASKMKSSKFMLYNAIGSFIRSASTVIIWVFFVKYYKILLEYSWTIMTVILACIWLYIYKFKKEEFKTYIKEKNEELNEKTNK